MRRWRSPRNVLPTMIAGLALAACSRGAPDQGNVVVVDAAARRTVEAIAPSRPGPAPTATPSASPSARRNPQLARPVFRDPPLPPELVDDGTLAPLPPPPPPSAFGAGNQH